MVPPPPVAKAKEPLNPFYVVLVFVGVVFLVTACAYGTMTWRATQPEAVQAASVETSRSGDGPATPGDPHPLMQWIDRHGFELLGGELALLALATFAAMGLDSARTRSAERAAMQQAESGEAAPTKIS